MVTAPNRPAEPADHERSLTPPVCMSTKKEKLRDLRMTRVSKAAQGTQLIWAADHFSFIDADLNTQQPGNAAPGSVTASGRRE
jgi:hypothetical protein